MSERMSTGISGLDEVLYGGLIPVRAYLVRGGSGAGKTTLGLSFLVEGVASGEKPLYITLGESAEQIRTNAERIGFDTQGITFLDLSPTSDFFSQVQTYDIFSAAEVEREPMTQQIVDQVRSLQPQRVFLDAMTQFRYLSSDTFQFRKQVLSFLRFLLEKGVTVLFSSEDGGSAPDDDLQFMSDGVIHLQQSLEGRSISVTKFRGSDFRPGLHFMRLTDRGMEVFPRLQPEVHKQEFKLEVIPSGVPDLDELMRGGIERGTVTLFTGPSGVGKTTIGLQFMKEAAGRGERSVVYMFEEPIEVMLHRCEAINIPVYAMMQRQTLSVIPIEPLLHSPDEFANMVQQEVEQQKARIVMIDSVSGYRVSLRGRDEVLVTHLHALCKYLQNMGVTVILVNETESITGNFRATEIGISYMADNIIFLRYLEIKGEIRKAIGVLKKRLSSFEKTLRELEITRYGIKVGKPLTHLRNILSGTPEWIDKNGER
ncbi:MAG: Circadian clock protein kinase KaiC [Chroococcidiopsis sp. SAG 2025]|uniref:ATPase domain-containing protein n=1 Tax=Chroococcidiopsis sp. SAG 2025 TaxID=171389 RepID=UPI0029370E2C|nr:ATPase domain-containing protein [Chroococcidiopsis sp. SAG 2025]MDV2991651.1 Circadian clock protein kinase KaiC [Chroococcidiopsis sp. SAG 2025]